VVRKKLTLVKICSRNRPIRGILVWETTVLTTTTRMKKRRRIKSQMHIKNRFSIRKNNLELV
jgi:hypothetical protein